MPFPFRSFRPKSHGLTHEGPPVTASQYLGSKLKTGYYESFFARISRMEEWRIAEGGPELTPKEAQAKWGLPGLEFNEPINDERARLLHERQKKTNERDYYMTQGHTGLLGKSAGFLVEMTGTMLTPIDLPLSFVPITRVNAGASVLGKGALKAATTAPGVAKSAFRGGINKGFIPIGANKYPVVTSSFINNAIWQTAAEVPRFIEMDLTGVPDYNIKDSALNVLFGVGLGMGVHLGAVGAGRMLKRASRGTMKWMWNRALGKAMRNEGIDDLHELALMDPNLVREQIIFDEVAARKKAGVAIDAEMQAIHNAVLKNYQHGHIRTVRWWKDFGPKILKTAEAKAKKDAARLKAEGVDIPAGSGKYTNLIKRIRKMVQNPTDLENLRLAVEELDADILKTFMKSTEIDTIPVAKRTAVQKLRLKFWQERHNNLSNWRQALNELHSYSMDQPGFGPEFKEGLQDLNRFNEDGSLKPEFEAEIHAAALRRPDIEAKVNAEVSRRMEQFIAKERAAFDAERAAKAGVGPEAVQPTQTAREGRVGPRQQEIAGESATPQGPEAEASRMNKEATEGLDTALAELENMGMDKKEIAKARQPIQRVPVKLLKNMVSCIRSNG